MFRHLLRPLSYLFIEHKQKWRVYWLYPLLFSSMTVGVLFLLKKYGAITFYADGAVIAKILGFVQNLPGFYIAALAAIATFNKIDIDKTMPSPAPRIDIIVQGKSIAIELTRRRFLCSMFAFLTAESMILVMLSVFGQTISVPVKAMLSAQFHVWASALFMLIYMFIFLQMLITTFWGLYYLGDRLHQPDQ